MGNDEQRIYEPYIHISGEWAHIGEGTIFEATNISGGEAINKLRRSYEAAFDLGDEARRLAASFFRAVRKRSKSRRKSVDRSRRNNKTVKRYAHGRTQRTRRNANDNKLPE